mgnify:CR=1 FL=1
MSIPYSEPDPAGSERARISRQLRDLAAEVARIRPQALTEANREEAGRAVRRRPSGRRRRGSGWRSPPGAS